MRFEQAAREAEKDGEAEEKDNDDEDGDVEERGEEEGGEACCFNSGLLESNGSTVTTWSLPSTPISCETQSEAASPTSVCRNE